MNIKTLTLIIFFSLVFIDTLGIVLPNIIDRQIITYFPIPILLLIFILFTKFSRPLHITALIFTFLGVCYFSTNLDKHQRIGLLFYACGIIIYIYNILRVQNVFNLNSVIKYALVFILVLLTPTLFYLNYIDKDLFYPIIFYINGVGFLFYVSILSYVNSKTKFNKALLTSGILLALSTIFAGYNLFIAKSPITSMLNILTFLLAHFYMSRYAVFQLEAENEVVKPK